MMEPNAVAGVAAVLVLYFALLPEFPAAGVLLTVVFPWVPMPAALCGLLGVSQCDSMLVLTLDESFSPHVAFQAYLVLVWLVIPIGMSQSASRGELFDLKGQITFYKSYHTDPINVAIHAVCIPMILWTAIGLFGGAAPIFIGAPEYLDWSVLPMLLYSSYYLRMAWPQSPVLAVCASTLVVLGWCVHHSTYRPSFDTLFYLHIGSWLAQFWGHGVHEGRASCLLPPASCLHQCVCRRALAAPLRSVPRPASQPTASSFSAVVRSGSLRSLDQMSYVCT